MAWLKGPLSNGFIQVGRKVQFNEAIRFGSQVVEYFVDVNNGDDARDGLSWARAKQTIQAAVTLANSSANLLKNVDIYVSNGLYEENVKITRAGTGAGSSVMLWSDGGQNIGGIGRLRIIGSGGPGSGGGSFLYGGDEATYPTISIGRPNVEIHDFATIKMGTSLAAGSWYDSEGISGSAHIEMPVIAVVDNYNADALLGGAGNNVLIKNCRINGGGVSGGVANLGAKWVYVIDSIIEYCDDYGLAIIGTSKGSPAENRASGVLFHQNADADILHGNNLITWIDGCYFMSATVTKHLERLGAGGASAYCQMSNCWVHDEDLLESANNAGWDACGIYSQTNGGPLASDDLTGDNWVSGDA